MLETVATLEREGVIVELAVTLLDREQGGEKNLRDRGITAIRCVCVCVCGSVYLC